MVQRLRNNSTVIAFDACRVLLKMTARCLVDSFEAWAGSMAQAQALRAKEERNAVMMSKIVQRMLSAEAKLDSDRLRTGKLRHDDWPKLSKAMGKLSEAPLFIDDTPGITMMEIRSKCRRIAQRHGLSLIVVIGGFNIVSILSMTVAERQRDIGILRAMGLTQSRIAWTFSMTGLRIGFSGIVIGSCLGMLVCGVQMVFEPLKLPGNVFIVNALPVEPRVWDLLVITGVSILLCYLFALIPARDAARLRPVDAIRR